MNKRLLLLLLGIVSAWRCVAGNWYVATNGNDTTGDGTIGNPAATISKGVQLSRADGIGNPKTVFVRGGNYYNVRLSIDVTSDGNLTIAGYPGESAVIYGGQLLTNWNAAGSNNWYSASLGSYPATGSPNSLTAWQPRMLIADGVVCTIGRLPQTGKFHYTSLTGGTNLVYTNDFPATTNMELWIDKSWSDSEMAVTNIDTGTKTLTLHKVCNLGPNTTAADVAFAVRNIPEAIYADNQFWWDKTNNVIVYRSPGNADPNGKTMLVPTQDRIFWFQGFTSYITNIVISNLTFACTTGVYGDGSTTDDYGKSQHVAVRFSNSTNCIVDGCTFYGLGGSALGNESASADNNLTIQNCIFRDIGISAVYMENTSGTIVSNCLVYNCGLLCQGAPGIFGGKTGGAISHNTVSNTTSQGIMILHNTGGMIDNNWVVRSMTALRDGGGIYIDGGTNVSLIHNFVAEINGTNCQTGTVWDDALFGLYCDNGSYLWLAQSNIVLNCTRPNEWNYYIEGGLGGPYATNLNNFYVNTRSNELTWFYQGDPSSTFLFQQNVFKMSDSRFAVYNCCPLVDSNILVASWSSNIVWSSSGDNSQNPTNATSSDPLFVKVPTTVPVYLEDADFSFQIGSPCPGLGIQSLSLSGIGYNGGLQHRPPGANITTLRVGNMRMAQ